MLYSEEQIQRANERSISEYFRQFANIIFVIQKAIDDVNELLIGGENAGEFVFQSECFLI